MSARISWFELDAPDAAQTLALAANLDGASDLTATARAVIRLTGALTGGSDTEASLDGALPISAELDGAGDLTANLTLNQTLIANLDGAGDLTASPINATTARNLPIGATLDVAMPITTTTTERHRLLLQATPTADPTIGINLPERDGSGLIVNDAQYNLDEPLTLTAGDLATVRVTHADVKRAVRGTYPLELALLSLTAGGTWVIQSFVTLMVDTRRPTFLARARRAANGDVIVLVLADEDDAISATATGNAGSVTSGWQGLRGQGGARAWLLRLPATTTTLTVTLTDLTGNTFTSAVALAEQPVTLPDGAPAWNLPPWLRAPTTGAPDLAHIVTAAEAGLNDSGDAARMVNPTSANDAYLDQHGRLLGARRFTNENDSEYRSRVLAVPRSQHLSRGTLEAHLTEIAGGARITISDASFGASETFVRLDGTRRLDGSWQLGGIGTSLPAGEYLVRLDQNPLAPIDWVLSELQRLRPMGLKPTVKWVRDELVGINLSLRGARDLGSPSSGTGVLDFSQPANSGWIAY